MIESYADKEPVDTETKPTAADGEQPEIPLGWNDDDGEVTTQEVSE